MSGLSLWKAIMLLIPFCGPFWSMFTVIVNTEPCSFYKWQQIHSSSEHKVTHFEHRNVGAV